MDIQITKNSLRKNGWVSGKYFDLEFEAKIYDEPSTYGINEGRISKLAIRKDGKEIYAYDRGLDHSEMDDLEILEFITELETTV